MEEIFFLYRNSLLHVAIFILKDAMFSREISDAQFKLLIWFPGHDIIVPFILMFYLNLLSTFTVDTNYEKHV